MLQINKHPAFTLIELLVVISIIGLLASVVLVSLNNARSKARVTRRLADMKQIQTALEVYFDANSGTYPSTAGSWRSQCSAWGGYASDQVIPGIVPNYMSKFPADPSMNQGATNYNCYLYRSDGTNYKFMIYNLYDMNVADVNKSPFKEPYYDSQNTAPCNANLSVPSLSVWSPAWQCAG